MRGSEWTLTRNELRYDNPGGNTLKSICRESTLHQASAGAPLFSFFNFRRSDASTDRKPREMSL